MTDTVQLFWNVDTQFDFIDPSGKLYVKGAEVLKPIWKALTELAKDKNIRVINTADYHYKNSAELSEQPDFTNTFPEHCMAKTNGAAFIDETKSEDSCIFDWDQDYLTLNEVFERRNIVIRKDAFDVFTGSPHTESILKLLAPKSVVVYGVTTNVCVNDAVVGLAKRIEKVYVIEDAIKELPNIPLPFDNWKTLGVTMISFAELRGMM